MSTYINIEILHSLPFSNANRDDAGQPKTIRVGGKTRGRISSQSLKRAARFYGADASNGFGVKGDISGGQYFRTQYVKSLITDVITNRGFDASEYEKKIDSIFGEGKPFGKSAKKDKDDVLERVDALIVVTSEEVEKLADLVLSEADLNDKEVKAVLASSAKRDIALWGRFFASDNTSTLDGSAQVAHAFTTHAVKIEDDFFVGLDDAAKLYSSHAGAGHPGDAFYINGVFYKYANVNIEETVLNVSNAEVKGKKITTNESHDKIIEDSKFAVADFLRSFSMSVPQGKIRSTAHTTLPSYIRVSITKDRPINASTAFDKAVTGDDLMEASVKALEGTHSRLNNLFGSPESELIVNVESEETTSLDEIISSTSDAVAQKVESYLRTLDAGVSEAERVEENGE